VLTKDGEIITPLSVGGTGGMHLLRFDPEWLDETARKTDFSAGLEGWSVFGTKGTAVLPHPDRKGAQGLRLSKPEADWPAAAVWNFPSGARGQLMLRLRLNRGFAGVRIGLTDHFSVPFDPEDRIYNLFNLTIGPTGELAAGSALVPDRWHSLRLDWNRIKGECRVFLDGRPVQVLSIQRQSSGVSYLRLVSTAEGVDTAGVTIESVEASVSGRGLEQKR
jgi:hypothetical protein